MFKSITGKGLFSTTVVITGPATCNSIRYFLPRQPSQPRIPINALPFKKRDNNNTLDA
jgi:hypothetical protein